MTKKIIGKRFGRLVVVGVAEVKRTESRSYLYRLQTRCDCGDTYLVWENVLRRQKTSMCPRCRESENPMAGHPLASIWAGMHTRCYDQKSNQFKNYGGRGVYVCERWRRVDGDVLATRAAFWRFVEDMGERPDGYTLERVDNDGPYSKDNCVWAPSRQQQLNKRNTRRVDGCAVADLERRLGLRVGAADYAATRYNVPLTEVVASLEKHTPGSRVRWQQLLGVERKSSKKPTTTYTRANIPPMHRHNFFLPKETVAELRKVAEARGETLSEVVRTALDAWLRAYKKRQEALK